jgi:hypothetical protein
MALNKAIRRKSKRKSTIKRRSSKRRAIKRRAIKRRSSKRRAIKRRSSKRRAIKRRSSKRRAIKRRSSKRRAIKRRSSKRRSSKRRSSKRRSSKRRSSKRRSSKRRSSKRRSSKRRSSKRRAIKRRSSKRRSSKRRSSKRGTLKALEVMKLKNEELMNDRINKVFKKQIEYMNRLKQKEFNVLVDYVEFGNEVNAWKRKDIKNYDENEKETYEKIYKELDRILKKCPPLEENVIAFRGVTTHPKDHYNEPGSHHFVSATLLSNDPDWSGGNYIYNMVINILPGNRVLPLFVIDGADKELLIHTKRSKLICNYSENKANPNDSQCTLYPEGKKFRENKHSNMFNIKF